MERLQVNDYLVTCLIVCPLIFFGAFVDSIAGGGGIITIPAYMLAGLPPHIAIGTNKLVASCGSVTASIKYIRSGTVDFSLAVYSMAGAVLGGIMGSKLALYITADALKAVILISLPIVAVFMLIRRDFGQEVRKREYGQKVRAVIALMIGVVIGCYDGIIGAGAGTFMIIAFTGLLGLDLLGSAACSRVSNTSSNVAAMLVFVLNGQVNYAVAAPAVFCSIAGGFLGSRFAVKGGSRNVRKIMMAVMVLMIIKIAYDLIV